MKVCICGSRTIGAGDDYTYPQRKYTKEELIWFFDCLYEYHLNWPITEVVSGGAAGADKFGEIFAEVANVPVKLFLPDWKKHGKSAGFKRNKEMVEYADAVICFWDSHSRGTQHTIELTEKADKPLTIWRVDYFAA